MYHFKDGKKSESFDIPVAFRYAITMRKKTQTIYLIRHGMTEGNLKKQYIGSTDQPLCEQGRKELGRRVAEGQYPRVAKLFSSPMKRALETGRLLYPALTPVVMPELREMDFGPYEEKTFAEIGDVPCFREWVESGGRSDFPGAETNAQIAERVRVAYNRILEETREFHEDIAVITHGGVIMELMSRLFPKETEGDRFRWLPENGGWVGFPANRRPE